jgi:8-oxo-dGTP pyrophosphatase MutT (NUDIX family)
MPHQERSDEYWDVYDAERRATGRLHRRGDPLGPGDYHLVAEVWTIDLSGRVLLTKRHPSISWGGLWACTGGCAVAGEDSRAAAVRELGEEVGLVVHPDALEWVDTYCVEGAIHDVWVHYRQIHLDELVLQEDEVTDAKLVTLGEFRQLHVSGAVMLKLSMLLDFVASGQIRCGRRTGAGQSFPK